MKVFVREMCQVRPLRANAFRDVDCLWDAEMRGMFGAEERVDHQHLDAAHALGLLHARKLMHRDVSPRNLWRTPDGRVKLIDFGIAVRRSARNGLFNRFVFEPLKQMDMNAWVKLKYGRRIDPETERDVLSAEDAAIYRPLWIERLARAVRVPWQTITLRRPRQRWRAVVAATHCSPSRAGSKAG